ncbi:hypothetical protein PanWU01x14_151240, partial [Parasponia andersonii]
LTAHHSEAGSRLSSAPCLVTDSIGQSGEEMVKSQCCSGKQSLHSRSTASCSHQSLLSSSNLQTPVQLVHHETSYSVRRLQHWAYPDDTVGRSHNPPYTQLIFTVSSSNPSG